MGWQLEIGKIVLPALFGFILGRLQTSYSDRVNRTKDLQNELLKSIRACAVAAIDYHTLMSPKDQVVAKSIHLKNQLWRIRTDTILIKTVCKQTDDLLLEAFVELLDAVTEFPFEPTELNQVVDASRSTKISLASERLAGLISSSRPKLF